MKPITLLCAAVASILILSTGISEAQIIPTTGLTLWLKSDTGITFGSGSSVATWADQSGNGNDVSNTTDWQQPVLVTNSLNGYPVLNFDGINPGLDYAYLQTANTLDLTSGLTVFVVALQQPGSGTIGLLRSGPVNTISAGEFQVDFLSNATVRTISNNSQYPTNYSEVDGYNAGSPGTAFVYQYAATPSTVSQKLDGVNDTDSVTGSYFVPSLTNYITIGMGQQGVYWAGDIAEVLIYDTALSVPEQDVVYNYLDTKYFTAVPEPSSFALIAMGMGSFLLLRRRRRE